MKTFWSILLTILWRDTSSLKMGQTKTHNSSLPREMPSIKFPKGCLKNYNFLEKCTTALISDQFYIKSFYNKNIIDFDLSFDIETRMPAFLILFISLDDLLILDSSVNGQFQIISLVFIVTFVLTFDQKPFEEAVIVQVFKILRAKRQLADQKFDIIIFKL